MFNFFEIDFYNQIEVGFLSQPERVVDRYDPDLLPGGPD